MAQQKIDQQALEKVLADLKALPEETREFVRRMASWALTGCEEVMQADNPLRAEREEFQQVYDALD